MPANTITLKDKDNNNVVFQLRGVTGDKASYVSPGATLAEVRRLDLTIKEHAQTFRVIGKLSVPTVVPCESSCTSTSWTEIGSFDLASVKSASSDAQEDFLAMFASFVASDEVSASYTTGV